MPKKRQGCISKSSLEKDIQEECFYYEPREYLEILPDDDFTWTASVGEVSNEYEVIEEKVRLHIYYNLVFVNVICF